MNVAEDEDTGEGVQPDAGELLAAMPQTVRDEAESMLADPELLKRVVVDIRNR